MKSTMKAAITTGVCFVLCLWPAVGRADSIRGTVTDDSGAPVAGALVTARIPDPNQPNMDAKAKTALVFLPGSVWGSSDSQGNFTIDGLDAGTYALCVSKPGSELLDPCLWSASLRCRRRLRRPMRLLWRRAG